MNSPKPQAVLIRLRRAIQLIEQDGWCKGTMVNARGQRCLAGALAHTPRSSIGLYEEGIDPVVARVECAACEEVIREFLPPCCSITGWNDRYNTSKEDVLLLLRRAEALLAKRMGETI